MAESIGRPVWRLAARPMYPSGHDRLETVVGSCRSQMPASAALWVSWPKKASKVPTDISEDAIRAVALPLGLVDIKVCAVDDVWSGLKLVVRRELR